MEGHIHICTGSTILLRTGVNTVGRGQECDVKVTDSLKSVSRRQAELHVFGDRVEIIDVDSKYGTYINDHQHNTFRLARNELVNLQRGDIIRFGCIDCIWELQLVSAQHNQNKMNSPQTSNSVNVVTRDDSRLLHREDRSAIIRDNSSLIHQDNPSLIHQDNPSLIHRDNPSLIHRDNPNIRPCVVRLNRIAIKASQKRKMPGAAEQNRKSPNISDQQRPSRKRTMSEAADVTSLETELTSKKWSMPKLVKLAKYLFVESVIGSKSKATYVTDMLALPVPVKKYTVNELLEFFPKTKKKKPARDSVVVLTRKIQNFLPTFENIKRDKFLDRTSWYTYVTTCAATVYRLEDETSANESYSFDWYTLEFEADELLKQNQPSDVFTRQLIQRAENLRADAQFQQSHKFQTIFNEVVTLEINFLPPVVEHPANVNTLQINPVQPVVQQMHFLPPVVEHPDNVDTLQINPVQPVMNTYGSKIQLTDATNKLKLQQINTFIARMGCDFVKEGISVLQEADGRIVLRCNNATCKQNQGKFYYKHKKPSEDPDMVSTGCSYLPLHLLYFHKEQRSCPWCGHADLNVHIFQNRNCYDVIKQYCEYLIHQYLLRYT